MNRIEFLKEVLISIKFKRDFLCSSSCCSKCPMYNKNPRNCCDLINKKNEIESWEGAKNKHLTVWAKYAMACKSLLKEEIKKELMGKINE